jgi:hypothetical protein
MWGWSVWARKWSSPAAAYSAQETVAPTEYVVTRLKAGYLLDDRFDPSGNIHTAELTLGLRSQRVGTKRLIM